MDFFLSKFLDSDVTFTHLNHIYQANNIKKMKAAEASAETQIAFGEPHSPVLSYLLLMSSFNYLY